MSLNLKIVKMNKAMLVHAYLEKSFSITKHKCLGFQLFTWKTAPLVSMEFYRTWPYEADHHGLYFTVALFRLVLSISLDDRHADELEVRS